MSIRLSDETLAVIAEETQDLRIALAAVKAKGNAVALDGKVLHWQTASLIQFGAAATWAPHVRQWEESHPMVGWNVGIDRYDEIVNRRTQ